MSKQENVVMTASEAEELRAQFFERLDSGYYWRPLVPVAAMPVSERMAAAIAANPESVRISARGVDGTLLVEGVRPDPWLKVCINRVRWIDDAGRPRWRHVG